MAAAEAIPDDPTPVPAEPGLSDEELDRRLADHPELTERLLDGDPFVLREIFQVLGVPVVDYSLVVTVPPVKAV